ncbi:MAG: ABC transporter ATP-binding protein [Clostridiales bacterium]|nr:ABC transporter ATP-binding protein [Clostridiales bacterium]
MDNNFIEVINLKKHFNIGDNTILRAVDDVSFSIKKGETFGLVGESGSGKTTVGRTIMGLYTPTSGKVLLNGVDIHSLKGKGKKEFRRKVQMIFQDPYGSLDPRMTVEDIIGEGIDIFNIYKGAKRKERIYELLELVGLNREHAARFPHEFSGGQRQRIGIARALAIEPEFIVCDEPISALDVSIQAQVINLLIKLQKELQLTYLFIAHDLSMVKHISDRVGVMYLGKLVEVAKAEDLYRNPIHSYTKSLLSAIPLPDPKLEKEKSRIKFEKDYTGYFDKKGEADISRPSQLVEVEKDHFVVLE